MIDSRGNKIGDVSGQREQALLRSIRFAERLNDPGNEISKKSLADDCYSLAIIYNKKGENANARQYAERARQLYEELYQKNKNADTAYNLAFAYALLRDLTEPSDSFGLRMAKTCEHYFGETLSLQDTDNIRRNHVVSMIHTARRLAATGSVSEALAKYRQSAEAANAWPANGAQLQKLYYLGWCYEELYNLIKKKELFTSEELNREMFTAATEQYRCYKQCAELAPGDETYAVEYAQACDKIRYYHEYRAPEKQPDTVRAYTIEENRAYFTVMRMNPVSQFANFLLTCKWLWELLKPDLSDAELPPFSERLQRGCRKVSRHLARRTAEGSAEPIPLKDELALRGSWSEAALLAAQIRRALSGSEAAYADGLLLIINELEPPLLRHRERGDAVKKIMDSYFTAYNALWEQNNLLVTDDLRRRLGNVAGPVYDGLTAGQKQIFDELAGSAGEDADGGTLS